MNQIFTQESQFEEDKSADGKRVKERVAISRGSLILDQPFFGYLLGHFEIIPVEKEIVTYAVDNNHLYFNTSYLDDLIRYNENWKGMIKGILLHLLIHIIYRHHKRQDKRINKIWGYACDIVVFHHLRELKNHWQTPLDWEIPDLSNITEELLNHNAEKTYNLLQEMTEEKAEENKQGRGIGDEEDEKLQEDDNLEDFVMQQIAMIEENIGLQGKTCDLDQVMEYTQSNDDDLEDQYFEGILQTAYERQKGFGSLPEGLDRWISKRLSAKIDWKAKLSKYLQKIIIHDLTWTRPNTRMYTQGYYFPGSLKTNTRVIFGVDTSGSIDDEILATFLSEAQRILETITNVKLYVVDCDAEIQQIRIYEAGESIIHHKFIGKGGTDFRPVFDLENQFQPDVIIYITDGYGRYPEKAPHTPTIWVLTTEEKPPFGEIVYINNT